MQYDLEKYSIAETIRKKIEGGIGNPLLASLKSKIKLSAPFNSGSERFHSKNMKDHERFLGPGYYEFRTFVEDNKPKISFASPISNDK